ncbi:MAG: SMP-30/gluconolactonase/LRE family protein, partial [Candidatus Eremiobacteraeota bacterium]|nr:SMP-30/gluconolactonase/LRE family protein [Candidatus Eremiobacteraeota bacterium]
MPTGVAVDSRGVIYIADAAAQRIRVIARDGQVSTLAGGGPLEANSTWVAGGFSNGPGTSARFNSPMGIAVSPDGGKIFVADSMNHCIRIITRDGSVATYAGRPGQAGKADGPAQTAEFERPMGLALDKKGTLYVADYGVGVRKIDSAGEVATTSISATDTTGVTVSPGKRGTIVAAADSGIYFTHPESKMWDRIANDESRGKGETLRPASFYDVGHPVAVTALSDDDIVYTDLRTGALRYLNLYLGTLRVLTGNAGSDVANDQAGYRDGPLPVALLNEPLGITLGAQNSIVIADTGNRRIRRLTGLNLRGPVMPETQLLAPSAPPKTYRIAYVGNSFVWHNTMWDDSIEGRLQERLNVDGALARSHRTTYVTPYRI